MDDDPFAGLLTPEEEEAHRRSSEALRDALERMVEHPAFRPATVGPAFRSATADDLAIERWEEGERLWRERAVDDGLHALECWVYGEGA